MKKIIEGKAKPLQGIEQLEGTDIYDALKDVEECEIYSDDRDLIDILLDDECDADIVLCDENDREITFEQVAVIPYNERVYAILKPVTKIKNVMDDEAIVFVVDVDETGDGILIVEENGEIADAVFGEYCKLLEVAD